MKFVWSLENLFSPSKLFLDYILYDGKGCKSCTFHAFKPGSEPFKAVAFFMVFPKWFCNFFYIIIFQIPPNYFDEISLVNSSQFLLNSSEKQISNTLR